MPPFGHATLAWSAQEHGFGFPLLCDTDLAVAIAYGAAADASAKAASRIAALLAEDGTVIKVWDPAGTGPFPAEVMASL